MVLRAQEIDRFPRLVMLTAPNPGPKTLSGTHAYLVGEPEVYVIDPGPADEAYAADVAGWLFDRGCWVHAILLTHGHPDHAGAAPLLKAVTHVPVWASASMPEVLHSELGVDRVYEANQLFDIDGHLLEVVKTPGHTRDHVAFWLRSGRILFAGDTILGEGSTLIAPPEGNMRQYLASLDRIKELAPRLIAPGHGPLITDPEVKLKEYIEHRRQREEQILAVLEAGSADIDSIVELVYADVPTSLYGLARGSVEAQLEKLLADGKISLVGRQYRVAGRYKG